MEHYSIPAFDDGQYPAFEMADTILSGKYAVPTGAIFFSKLNPQFKRLWDPLCLSQYCACSTEFMVYMPTDKALRPFVYSVLNSDSFYRFTIQIASSSTGRRKRLDPDATLQYGIAIPDVAVVKQFCDQVNPILQRIKQLKVEEHDLA